MRYWIIGEDEDFERERQQRSRSGEPAPEPDSSLASAATLGALQVAGLIVAAAFMMLDS